VSPCALLGASWLSCRPPCLVAQSLPYSHADLPGYCRLSAATLPARRSDLHIALQRSSLHPPCSVPGCCSAPAYWSPACAPCSRHSVSPPPVPGCRPPCPQGSGLHPPCSVPPYSIGSSARHLGPAGLLPARRDGVIRQSAPSLSLLQTPVLCATVPGIVLLLMFDLSCLNFFVI
jgi:hypothetical protein